MSSAEDLRLLSSSPVASSTEPQREENPPEPAEADAPPLNPAPSLKTNMVAREVCLQATTLPPDKNTDERKLLTEQTSSVLVFDNGGVIRLSAAVAHGQLLVLTNIELKREVVAQVKRKRVYRPTTCFVELEFVEPAPGFWGMEFSAATALLPKTAQDAEAAALVISAEATAGDPGEPFPPSSVEDIQKFKREVEILRDRPHLMPPHEQSPQPQTLLLSPSEVPEPSSALSRDSGPTNGESRQAAGEAFKDISQSLKHKPDLPQWTPEEQALLPQPALDFSMSLPKRKRSRRARGSFTPNFRGGVLRLALLTTALVVTASGAAWYKHWMPWQSAAEQDSVRRPPIGAGANRMASDAPVTSAGMPSPSAALQKTVASETSEKAETSAEPAGSSASEALPVARKNSPPAALARKRSTDHPTEKASASRVAPSGAESVLVPPQLIKSVRAVASLEALRDFETGNVVIDAVVGTSGEVNFISVLSGPPSLRPAAVESLKQFRYEPATRNGQPVPAHVTITIHFRFEP